MDETESSPSPKSRAIKDLNATLDRKMGLPSNPRIEISSDIEEKSEEKDEEDVEMYEDFDIQGVSREELAAWAQLAPADQKLTENEAVPQDSQSKKYPGACLLGMRSYIMLIY